MLCKKCGKELPDGAAFCPWCGHRQKDPLERTRPKGRGSITKAANGTYTVTLCKWIQGTRYRKVKRGFKRKKEAEAYVDVLATELQAAADQATGKVAPINPMINYNLQQMYDAWMQSPGYDKLSESKKTHYRTVWKRMAGTWPICFIQLRLSHMQSILESSGLGYYPQRDIKALYSHLYKFAIKHEVLETNRVLLLELPETPNSHRDPWTMEEVGKWWEDYRAGHRVARIILIMIYTGMRTGEVRQQDLTQIDLVKHYMVGGIKTDAGKDRIISLADPIVPLISESITEAVCGLLPMRIEDFYDEYAEAVQRTGVRPLDPYSCRHTTATALGEAGVAPSIIKEIMGHRSYETTLHYTHVSTEAKLEAVNTLDQRGSGPR